MSLVTVRLHRKSYSEHAFQSFTTGSTEYRANPETVPDYSDDRQDVHRRNLSLQAPGRGLDAGGLTGQPLPPAGVISLRLFDVRARLLVPQRFNWIEIGGAQRRYHSADYAHHRENAGCNQKSHRRDDQADISRLRVLGESAIERYATG